jgi:hypothetical protein
MQYAFPVLPVNFLPNTQASVGSLCGRPSPPPPECPLAGLVHSVGENISLTLGLCTSVEGGWAIEYFKVKVQPCLIEITADVRDIEAQPMMRQSRDYFHRGSTDYWEMCDVPQRMAR